ncbi:hypothetical protein [Streptomyces sp. YKOK-J1]
MTGSFLCRAPGHRAGGRAREVSSRRTCHLAAGASLSPVPAVPAPPLSFPGPSSEQEPQA